MTASQGVIYGIIVGGLLFWGLNVILETFYPPKCRWCKRRLDHSKE